MKQPNLYIMCGLPRIGKSSWARKNKKGKVIISPDQIRKEIFGHQFHQEANGFVFAFAEGMATLLLNQGCDVIIDATNIVPSLRLKWKSIAQKCNAKVFIVWVYASKDMEQNLKIAKINNANGPSNERLPEEALERMALDFNSPSNDLDNSWSTLIEHRNVHRKKRNNNKS